MRKRIPPEAFDYYFALGPERSYERIAEKYGVSKRSVTSCAKRECWQKRIADLETKARKVSDRKKGESLEERIARHLASLRFVQARSIEALKRFPITTAMEAVRAYDLSLRDEGAILGFLRGGKSAEEHQRINIVVVSQEELERRRETLRDAIVGRSGTSYHCEPDLPGPDTP